MPETRGAVVRAIPQGPLALVRQMIRGVTETTWFGPLNPVPSQAPAGTPPRTWDYPFGVNLQYVPRGEEPVTFAQLRDLAQSWDLVATVIETRKDQVAGVPYTIRPTRQPGESSRDYKARAATHPDVPKALAVFRKPDGYLVWQSWIRKLVHEVLVTDALAILPDRRGGRVQLEVVDGGMITPLLDASGRRPAPPDPAYQQIVHGVPATMFTTDELLYRPRVARADKLYGFPPIEQILVTVNLALRRQLYKLAYYTEGNLPEAIVQMPETWTPDQIKQFQQYFDAMLAGQVVERRKAHFIPGIGGKDAISYPKQDALKDEMDEWLARVVCFAFSISPQPFIREMNRATAQTAQEAAKAEGLSPLLDWIAEVLTDCLQGPLGFTDLEFVWQEDVEPDPLKRAQIQEIQVRSGIKSPDEVREANGDDPIGVGPGVVTASGFVPFGTPAAEEDAETDVDAPPDEVQKAAPFASRANRRRLARTTTLVERFLQRAGEASAARLAHAYAAAAAPRETHLHLGERIESAPTPAPTVHVPALDLTPLADTLDKLNDTVDRALRAQKAPVVHVAPTPVTVQPPEVKVVNRVSAAPAPDVHVTVEPKLDATLALPSARRRVRKTSSGDFVVEDEP